MPLLTFYVFQRQHQRQRYRQQSERLHGRNIVSLCFVSCLEIFLTKTVLRVSFITDLATPQPFFPLRM